MSAKQNDVGNYDSPATWQDVHRPAGVPQARERESQAAQLESLPHGENKDVKRKMKYKTGQANWEEKAHQELERTSRQDRIEKTLDRDPDLRGYGINTEMRGDQANLSGIVDTLSEVRRAGRLAAGTAGVKAVDNDLTISTDGRITDQDVSREAEEELNADPRVNPRHIGVESRGGTAVLVGNTDDPAEIEAAREAASRARGVRQVASQVKLHSPEDVDQRDMSLEDIFHSQVQNDREE